MKIIYFIDHLRPDGTQTVLLQLVRGLARRGHQQAVVCLNDSWDGQVIAALRAQGAAVEVVGRAALLSGVGLARLLGRLRRERYDVVVTLLFFSDVIGRSLGRLAGAPRLVSSVQNANDHYYPWWQRLIARRIARWPDLVISCSASVRETSLRVERLPPERVVVVPNGISWEAYAAPLSHQALAAEFGLPAEALILGNVGRLTPQKGQDVLLDAFARLADPRLQLIIAGMGECEAALRQQAERLGIAQNVHFVGHRRDLPRILGGLDLYVHASRFEGMPIAVLEAMASGLPIVATGAHGTRELIEDGAHGWLVPAEDPAALAAAVAQALADPAERRRRGDLARSRAREQFSEEAMVAAWERLLMPRPDQLPHKVTG